jgi:hypothetical protein
VSWRVGVPFARYLIESYAVGAIAFGLSYAVAEGLSRLIDVHSLAGLAALGAAWSLALIVLPGVLLYLLRGRRSRRREPVGPGLGQAP